MNKKIFGVVVAVMIVATLMMSANMVSASLLTTRTYSNDDLTVQFETLYLDNIGTATLVSHNSVNEIKEVGWGEPKVVMYYDLDFEDIKKDGLGDVKIIDMNTGKIVDKDYEYVIWGTVEYEFPLYEEVCSQTKSFSTTCRKELIRYETREREDWIKYDSRDIPKQARIGLRTMVNEGDHYDAIWTMVDEKITKHAEWSAGLNVNLLDYYNFENGTGITAIDRVAGEYNLTGLIGTWVTDNGIQGTGSFKSTSAGAYMSSRAIGSLGDITINMWINVTGDDISDTIVGNGLQNGEFITREGNLETNLDWIVEDSAGYTDYPITKYQWHMVTLRFNNSVGYFIIDGVVMDVQAINPLSSQVLTFGGEPESTSTLYTYYDEIGIWNRTLSGAEITQLYNGGNGLLYTTDFTTPPTVIQNTPVNYYNTTSSDITFNCSATDDVGVLNLSLFIDGIFNLSVFNVTASSNLSLQRILGFPDGIHNWSCNATNTVNKSGGTETRFFTVDATFPTLNITFPTTDVLDGYATSNERTIYINWSSTDSNLDGCWYFNGTANVTVTCGDNATFTSPYGTYEFIVYANDTFGNIASDSITVTYRYIMLENNITYNSTTYDTSTESFVSSMNFTSSAWTDLSAVFNYNGTGYSSSKGGAGNNPTFSSTIDIEVVDTPNNKTFFWTFALTNNSGTFKYNSTTNAQEVKPSIFTACNSSYPTEVVNFSIFEETNPTTSVEVDFEATFEWYLGSGTVVKNKSFDLVGNSTDGNSTFKFCTSPNQTFSVDSTIDLSADRYNNRLYEFKNDIFNRTGEIRSLFMLNDTLESSIIIEVKDQGLAPLEGWNVEIWRYYPETGFFEMVESQNTDIYGQFVAKLIQNDVKYKFNFYNPAGDLIKETGKLTVACRTTICVLPFIIEDTTEDFDRFDNVTDYSYTFSYNNNTNVFTFTWTDNPGDASPIHNLLVKSYRFNESLVVCNTNSSALTGSLTCDVGTEELSYVAQVFRWVDGNKNRISTLSIKVGIGYKTFGKEGLFWSFILLMTLIAVGAWSPVVGVVLYMIGFVVLGFANVISFSPTLFISMLAIGVAFAWAFKS